MYKLYKVSASFGNYDKVQKLTYEGRLKEALHLVEIMAQETSEAPQEAFVCVLRGCTRRKAPTEGKQVHALIIKTKCDNNIFLSNLLIEMYSTCGSVPDALKVFSAMQQRNVFSWTAMISAYGKSRQYEEAISLFQQMCHAGIEPDEVACIVALKACTHIGALEQGRHLHSLILKKGLNSNVTLQNTLVNMYSKCGCLKDAREVFDNMAVRSVVSWNAMIAGYAQERLGKEALDLYEQMKREGMEPDNITLAILLKACTSILALQQGRELHSLILQKGLVFELVVQTTLIDLYSKCGCLKDARELFDNIAQRDVVSWNAMIAGYVQEGLGKEALYLFQAMQRDGLEPNNVTLVLLLKACGSILALQQGNQLHFLILEKGLESQLIVQTALIDMYSKCGCLKDAREMFDNMKERNVVSWNVMIAGYAQESLGKDALDLYKQMKREGIEPNSITFVLLLKACASISSLQQGKEFHSLVLEKGLESQVIFQNTLVDMYSKCGCLKDAREMFDTMTERNVVSWNAMIAGYAQEGLGKEALDLYEEMKHDGKEPNSVTLVLLLKACASIAALQKGKQLHSLVLQKGLESQTNIQNTLIDMYSKCECLKDARKLFDNMTERDVTSWNAIIAGYAQEGLGKEALDLYEQMKREGMEPNNVTLVVLLTVCASISALQQGKLLHSIILQKGLECKTNIRNTLIDMYSKCGRLKDARKLFDNMTERSVVSWNAMIAGYAQEGLGKEALDLFQQMKDEGLQANDVTYTCVLSACRHSGLVDEGCHVFESMSEDCGVTPFIPSVNTIPAYSCS